jgi:hypothetical protein
MPSTPKKPWHKPELIVIIRSNPEENVLLGCKYEDVSSQGPSGHKCNNNGKGCHLDAKS